MKVKEVNNEGGKKMVKRIKIKALKIMKEEKKEVKK